MSPLRIRAATPADHPFFRRLEAETTWESIPPEDRRRLGRSEIEAGLRETNEALLSRPGTRLLIAEDETGNRVGLLWMGVNRNALTGEDEAWVYSVAVEEAHRARGYGRELMAHAEELARSDGFAVLGLMVSDHNERASRLYRRLGFEPSSVLMRKRLSG